MSVDNYDIDNMIEVINNWGEINRQKDLEIQKLKEANSGSVINLRLKILKEENEKLNEHNLELNNECQTLKEDNEKLKEEKEIQKLLEPDFEDLDDDEKEKIIEIKNLEDKLIEKLKKENEKLKEEINHKNKKFEEWCLENQDLKEENEILKEANGDLLYIKEQNEEIIDFQKKENEKLIEEIECRKSTTDSEIAELNGEIKLLKEEIDKLQKPKPKKTITCSNCGQIGHNKRYCHNIGNTIKNITGQNQ